MRACIKVILYTPNLMPSSESATHPSTRLNKLVTALFVFLIAFSNISFANPDDTTQKDQPGIFRKTINTILWGTEHQTHDNSEKKADQEQELLPSSNKRIKNSHGSMFSTTSASDTENPIYMDPNKRKRKKPTGSSTIETRSKRKHVSKDAVSKVIHKLLEDPNFILPGTSWGPTDCENNLKNTVKLITGLAAAIFCPVNSLFISNESWKTRLLAAMGTVPLSAQFNFELIDAISYTLQVLKEKGIVGGPITYLQKYRENLKKMSTYDSCRTVAASVIKPATALYCGYWYALADSLSSERAGIDIGKKLGLSAPSINTLKAVTRWGNFYYTSLAGFTFYLGAVDLLSGQIFRCDKNLRQERLRDILATLDGMTDEKKVEHLKNIQFNSIVDLMDLQSENLDASFVNTKKGNVLINLMSASLEIAFTLLLPQANNDTFSSKRILSDACELGLTVTGNTVHYDQRIALKVAEAGGKCCANAIASVSNATQINAGTGLQSGCAIINANSTSIETLESACQQLSFSPLADVGNSTCTAACNIAKTPGCQLPLQPATDAGLQASSNAGLMSGLFQGAGLVCKTLLTIRAGTYLASDLIRYRQTGSIAALKKIPPSVYMWKALGYGEMAVCMWFYQTNIYLIMPIAHATNILHTVVKQKPLFGATPSTFISMTILGVPFMEGGEFLANLSKGGFHLLKSNTWDRIKGCFSTKSPHASDSEATIGVIPPLNEKDFKYPASPNVQNKEEFMTTTEL